MQTIDWDAVSALADAVMALTAIFAALYVLKQYRQSVRLQEIQQILDMYRDADSILNRVTTEFQQNNQVDFTESQLRSVINLIDVHERLISQRLLSTRVSNFYYDFLDIGRGSDKTNSFHSGVNRFLQENQDEYRHLINSLKSRESTKSLTEW
ncbi:hypothetical protein ELH48_09295 [Rhizobium ruizarguesonis]|uniref:hypothetical protein n=1 Tax=Rhizobium ruizarguesonis TaxID=2081791 RepID=UPI00103271AC|nr:hypothetical protein [Rhizobium ruizarguesonis]TBB27330.1 hypothetical protein ELH48_09295 [Rhizobium ruizarguesonis]